MPLIVNLTETKARLSELVAAVVTTHDYVEITRGEEPAAALVSLGQLWALRETVAMLSDVEVAADLREAGEDVASGRLTDAVDLWGVVQARHRGAA